MIYPVEMYSADCDRCGKDYEEEFTGFSALADQSALGESLEEAGWHITDDKKIYCPDCHEIGEDDMVTIKSNPDVKP